MQDVIFGFDYDVRVPNLSVNELIDQNGDLLPRWLSSNTTKISTLAPEAKYIYYVSARAPNFFVYKDLPALPAHIKQDVDNRRTSVLFFQPYEGGRSWGNAGDDYQVIEDWIDRSQIDPRTVHFIHGNLKPYSTRFHLHHVQAFELWNALEGTPAVYNGDKVFVNYNRIPRSHRVQFVAEMIRTGLDKYGYISFNTAGVEIHEAGTYHKALRPIVEQLRTTRLLLDTDSVDNLAMAICKNHYSQTLLSLVSETLAQPGTLFISEKTWKPIQQGHPFMIFGNPGTLAYLRSFGFDTFDNFFDTRYDDIEDVNTRMYHILGEIKRLSTFTKAQRISLSRSMSATCQYNQRRFSQHVTEKYGRPIAGLLPLKQIIQQIWTSLCEQASLV
jgi:hypothetical protein